MIVFMLEFGSAHSPRSPVAWQSLVVITACTRRTIHCVVVLMVVGDE